MAKPVITIRSQARVDRIITITFVVKGGADTVTVDLPAALVPNGATSRPRATVTLNAAGEGTCIFSACPYGNYAEAVVTATNADGTSTATTWPMTLFVPGTAPVGTPRALLPAYVAAAFPSSSVKVAIGSAVTDFKLESDSTTAQTNLPFTFGQPFRQGDLAPTDFLVGKIAGEPDIALQFNVKATHPDGSVRHAVISGVLPTLNAGAVKTVSMVRASSGASTAAVSAAAIAAAGFTAKIDIVTGGVAYTADATQALAANAAKPWLTGAIANDYIADLAFVAADGSKHPDLAAQIGVRHYPGIGCARVDVSIEHIKAYTAVNDIGYSGSVSIGGGPVMPISAYGSSADLVHFAGTRWKRTFWWNNSKPVHVRHNVAYLIDSKQVSNYRQDLVFSESLLAGYETKMQGAAFHMMGNGLFAKVFAGTGGRPELGLASNWYVTALLSQDKRAKKLMYALADCAGSWNTHRRDTSTGPAGGTPLDIIHFPRATILGAASDSKNTASGQFERIPNRVSVNDFGADTSHQSAFAYIPYLLSGDFYYLEELHFWANYCLYNANPGTNYRNSERGEVKSDQVRGQAWTLRTVAQAAAITPDDHQAKPRFNYWLQNNLSWFNAQYTDNPNVNKLGIMTHGISIIYDGPVSGPDTGIGNFQEDFFNQSFGHIAELGFGDAARMMRWKSKWPVSRLIGQGICWMDAVTYSVIVRTAAPESRVFDTIAEVMQASGVNGKYTNAAIQALPCGSQERVNEQIKANFGGNIIGDLGGYAATVEGFPSVLQPALAAAVDAGYPDADLAWDLFESRTRKPDYSTGPQFAIVPRGFVAPPPDPTPDPDPDPDPNPDPQPTDPEIMAIADNVKDSTTTTGLGDIALAGAPQMNFKPWLTPPITIGARVPYVIRHRTQPEWETGFGHLSSELVLVRDVVASSSNNNERIDFSEGVKDVSCDLTAALFEELAGAHNVTASSVAEGQTVQFMMMVGDKPQRLAAPSFGAVFKQMALLPGGLVLDADEIIVNRSGTSYRAPRTYLGSSTPADTTAPILSSASASATSASGATASVTTNEGAGTLYCLVSTASTASPSSVKAGTAQTVTGTGSKNFAIGNLTASTVYYAHFLHSDAAGNESAVLSTASFTTPAAADTTAPTLSSPTASSTGSTTASASVTTNEANGTLYCLFSTVVPTATQVKAGMSQAVASTGAKAFNGTGLVAGSTYSAYFLHRDAAGNDSTVVASTSFTTPAETPTGPIQSLWTGEPTPTGATITAKPKAAATSMRVAVSTSEALTSPVYTDMPAPDATYRHSKLTITGKAANTEYWYAVEVDGVLDTTTKGRFKTLPTVGSNASFTIAMGGCAENTNDAAFTAIAGINPRPLLMITMGDHQYMDLTNPSVANYNSAFDTTFARAARSQVARELANIYMWDDHDIQTDSGAGRSSAGVATAWRANALAFYRSRVPNTTASNVAGETVHGSFVVGRVRFVKTDLRSDRWYNTATDDANKTMMGAAQKAWFKAEITAAKNANQIVAWINNSPWVAATGLDTWGQYKTERTELADYIKAEGMGARVFILSSDMHAMAIHTGIDYATGGGASIPVFQAGPLNRLTSHKGGPYTIGPLPAAGVNATQYGMMDVADNGGTITVTWTGYNEAGTVAGMTHSFTMDPGAVVTPTPTVPAKMAKPTVVAGDASATVTLVAPNDGGSAITKYTLTLPAGAVDQQANTTSLTRTITGLANNVAFTTTARAENAVGAGPYSDASDAVTPQAAPASGVFEATGGTITTPGDGYKYWTFLSSADMNVQVSGAVDYLVVAGGGAGSRGSSSAGAGGGAGGLLTGQTTIAAGIHAITVGQGGVGNTTGYGTSGGDSSIGSLVVAKGGGAGGHSGSTNPGLAGGSGGGGGTSSGSAPSSVSAPGTGTAGQGNDGGAGFVSATQSQRAAGGGGGAGSVGGAAAATVAGNGGAGVTLWGRSLAGGGGGSAQLGTQGQGTHGGGNGGNEAAPVAATAGAANTGGGGGGFSGTGSSANGGSGIVILRRPV